MSAFQALVRNHAYVSGSQIPKIFIRLPQLKWLPYFILFSCMEH